MELLRVECEVVGKMQKSLGNENCYEKQRDDVGLQFSNCKAASDREIALWTN